MPVSFDRINAREYRHRCFIFNQLQALAKSKPGGKIKGLKRAVDEGYSRVENKAAGDAHTVFVIAHRMDTTGATRAVRYTTLFAFNAQFFIFQADPAKDETFRIAMCAQLTMQQFKNFVDSFARDAGEQFGFQDAEMNRVAAANVSAPINDVTFPASSGQQMMPGVMAAQEYGQTPGRVGGGQIQFAQAVQNVANGQAQEIYM